MPTDIAKVKEQLANMSSLGFSVFKCKYGAGKDSPIENKVKLFSWPPKGGQLAKRVLKHYFLGADGKAQDICPKTFGVNNTCPICTWIEAANKSEDPTLVERVKKIRQQERYMQLIADWNVFERENDPAKKKWVGIYDCPPKIHRNIMQEMASNDYDFTEWESSLVSFVGYALGPGLPKAVDFKVTLDKMKPQIVKLNPEEWLPLMPPLDDIFKCPTPQRLQQLLDGVEASDEEEETQFLPKEDREAAKEEPKSETKSEPVASTETKMEAKAETTTESKPAAKEEPKAKKTLADLVREAKERKTASA